MGKVSDLTAGQALWLKAVNDPATRQGISRAQERLRVVASLCEQAKESERSIFDLTPDGPLPGNRFSFGGKCHGMRPVPWKLLDAMWNHDERNMHDVEEEVWEVTGGSQLKDAMHDLKVFLADVGYPKYVGKAARSDSLVWKAF